MGWFIYGMIEIGLLILGIFSFMAGHTGFGAILLILCFIGLLPFWGGEVIAEIIGAMF